jgi:DNA-binding protein Fis
VKKSSIQVAIKKILDNFLLLQKDLMYTSNLYEFVITEVEKSLITRILQETRFNKNQTAKILGISRNTLLSKIKKLNLET